VIYDAAVTTHGRLLRAEIQAEQQLYPAKQPLISTARLTLYKPALC